MILLSGNSQEACDCALDNEVHSVEVVMVAVGFVEVGVYSHPHLRFRAGQLVVGISSVTEVV